MRGGCLCCFDNAFVDGYFYCGSSFNIGYIQICKWIARIVCKEACTTIATIVFDLLVVILLLAFGISSSIPSTVINVLSALIILASAVLYIVDLCLEKKRVEKVNKDAIAEPTEVKEEKPVVEEKTEEKK